MPDSLPQAPDSEKALLSCLMLDPKRRIPEFIEGGGTEDYFHKHDHVIIYRHLTKMWAEENEIDLTTVSQALEDSGAIGKVGGHGYVAEIYTFVPASSMAREYAETLKKKLIARKTIRIADDLRGAALNGGADLQSITQEGLVKISGLFESRAKTLEMPDLIRQALDRAEAQRDGGGKLRGLTMGMPDLDRETRGMKPGQMIIIAADTGVGKSALAMQIAKHNAVQGIPVAVFSLEMDAHALTDRLIANHSEIGMAKVEWGWLSEDESLRFTRASAELSGSSLIIRDEAFMSPLQFQAAARKLKADKGVQLIIIDYLQLMDTGESSDDHKTIAVARCSRTVKLTAKELGIPIIALSQLTGDNPMWSRSIMQDCDLFLILETDNKGGMGDMQIRIKKGRDCEKNKKIPLAFRGEYVKFSERAN